jgi:hypothetical protein
MLRFTRFDPPTTGRVCTNCPLLTLLLMNVTLITRMQSLNQDIPYTCIRKSKFPCWFSGILKHYINKKNNLFRR